MKALVLIFAMLLSATTVSFAQSLPNFGANAPSYGDSYGKPVSGTYPPVGYGGYGGRYRAYAYQPRYHRHHRYLHRRYWW